MKYLGLLATILTVVAVVAGVARIGQLGVAPGEVGQILWEQTPFVLGLVGVATLIGWVSVKLMNPGWVTRMFGRRPEKGRSGDEGDS